ncbi:NAD(P)-binding protein [Aspergillus ibericus CBS 121593]|uniref:NAD(P)-binding protein n=1 Tax=Aspergillus ibericus CBS 121593 TaxID=1448316 RepID=A0A395H0D1_9EURO|nr:NAD(P)-binding protein [Aspergillus ibericus CBS 121593]RAL00765.1 NAD(P)-binding protein [Aspergillus ibericus CBS 121593]
MPLSTKPIAIIAGAGPGTGAALARRFAQRYPVVLLARTPSTLDPLVHEINRSGGSALGIPANVAHTDQLFSSLTQLRDHFGAEPRVAAAIFNVASKFTRNGFLENQPDFLDSLEATARGASNFSRAVLPLLLKEVDDTEGYPPTLIFTGATAALKGGSGLGSFAMSKFAVRALAQSLAREFGPKGVHVAHAIIDGIIATEKTKEYLNDRPDAKIDPKGIAEAYWFLHTQSRSAFTHEIDLRPYCETW